MSKKSFRVGLRRFFHSVGFSVFFLLVLVGGLAYLALNVTKSFEEEVDFGSIFTIRQSNMGLDSLETENTKLTQQMILDSILKEEVLQTVAQKYGWNVPIDTIIECIDVRERLSDQNSFVIMVNSNNIERSNAVARDLSYYFLSEYQKKWQANSNLILVKCDDDIDALESELKQLKALQIEFEAQKELRPLSTELEMLSINEQLLVAQTQFLTAFGAFISRLEEMRFNLEMELALAQQTHTDKSTIVKSLQRQLAEISRKCDESKKIMDTKTPDIYRMEIDYPSLSGFPNDIVYFYENVKKLQQLKLALLLSSIIENKELELVDMKKKKNTIERLLNSNSCDVFIREVN